MGHRGAKVFRDGRSEHPQASIREALPLHHVERQGVQRLLHHLGPSETWDVDDDRVEERDPRNLPAFRGVEKVARPADHSPDPRESAAAGTGAGFGQGQVADLVPQDRRRVIEQVRDDDPPGHFLGAVEDLDVHAFRGHVHPVVPLTLGSDEPDLLAPVAIEHDVAEHLLHDAPLRWGEHLRAGDDSLELQVRDAAVAQEPGEVVERVAVAEKQLRRGSPDGLRKIQHAAVVHFERVKVYSPVIEGIRQPVPQRGARFDVAPERRLLHPHLEVCPLVMAHRHSGFNPGGP